MTRPVSRSVLALAVVLTMLLGGIKIYGLMILTLLTVRLVRPSGSSATP